MFTEVFESSFDSNIRAPEAGLLLLLWRMSLHGADVPLEEQLPASRISFFRRDLMILRPLPDGDWRYEHYGANIAAIAGFDMTGRKVSDFQGPMRDFYLALYARVCRERRPLGSVHRLGQFGETPLWERLILPVRDGEAISGLYVVNKVREIEKDISHLNARSRGRGMMILQFLRSEDGAIEDALIVGANPMARQIIGFRLDELVGKGYRTVFPGLIENGLWQAYLDCANDRQTRHLVLDFIRDGSASALAVEVAPLHDGVTILFEPLAPSVSLSA
jgi:PAS domain-containing protein